jgi:hypothetical protein
MRSINEVLHTDGAGHWSNKTKPVAVSGMELIHKDGEKYGELRIFFPTESWNITEDGLIYTDRLFEAELKEYLFRAGYDASKLTYSEQGMQGYNYVSCDVFESFIKSWYERGQDGNSKS